MIDDYDRIILNSLSKDARMPLKEIGINCGLSATAVHQRIRKMEDNGVIKGAKLLVAPDKLGFTTMAFIGVYLERAGMYKEVSSKLAEFEEVVECSYTTGQYSLITKVYCTDNIHLMKLLSNKIQTIPGVSRTDTLICLEHSFEKPLTV